MAQSCVIALRNNTTVNFVEKSLIVKTRGWY